MLSIFQKNDTYLVRRTLAGHRESFSHLVERYQALVFAVAYGIVAHAADAEDVTQDAFLTAFKRLSDLREPEKFRAWLLAIARNRASDLIVKRRKESPLAEIDIAAPEPADTLVDAELRALLRERVERLPADHREILLLHYYAGFKVKEIAAQLDISTEAAKKRLQRARDLLSERMLVHLRDTVEERGSSAARTKSIVAAIAGASAAYGANAAAAGTGLFTVGALVKFAAAAVVVSGITAAILSAREPDAMSPPPAVPSSVAANAPSTPIAPTPSPAKTATAATTDAAPDANESSIAENFTLQGRIVNEADAAQAGIRVTVDAAEERQEYHEETTSDEDGHFSFPNLNPEHSYLLQGFRKDTFAAAELMNTSGPRSDSDVQTLVLLPAADLSGVVVDGEGHPISDASVVPYRVPINGRSEYVADWWQRLRGVRTDADGRFTLSHAWLGDWTLKIDAPAHAVDLPELRMPLDNPREFTLKAGATVNGRVIRAGTDDGVPSLTLAMGWRRAVTDAAGNFRFTGASSGEVNVELQKNDTLVVTSPSFATFPGQSMDGIIVEVAEGGVIRGRVLDQATGEPVTYASVDFIGSSSIETYTGQANEDGTYEITKLRPGRYTLSSVHGSGHAPVAKGDFKPIEIDYGVQVENVDIKLTKGRTVSGSVDFPAGESRNNIFIMVRLESGGGQGSSFSEQGEFEVGGLPDSGMVTVQLEGPGWSSDAFGPFSLDAGDVSGVNVVARRVMLKSIKGQVVRGGTPLRSNELVWLSAVDNSTTDTSRTSSDGRFTYDSVAPGDYKIHIPAYQGKEQIISVRANEEPAEVILDLSDGDGQISGRILDSRGAPVSGARVSAYGNNSFIPHVEVDESGRYTLPGLGDGTYDLTVQAEGFGIADLNQVAANSRDVDFRLEHVGHVEGTVIDARSGKPIGEFVIHTTGQTEERGIDHALKIEEGKRQVSPEGIFRALDLSPGEKAVIARAKGYFSGYSIVKVEPGETTANVSIRLEPTPGLTARLTDSEGAAIADAKVFINRIPPAFDNDGFNKETPRSDGSGIIPLENLRPGENTLYIYHPDHGRGIFTIDTGSQSGEQVLTLSAPGTLEGKITRGGEQVEHAQVIVSYAPESLGDNFRIYRAEVREDGTYSIKGLMPGEASLQVGGNGVDEERTVQIASGSTTTFDFDFAGGTGMIEITPVLPNSFAQARCAATLFIENSERKIVLRSVTQPDGTIQFEDLPAGNASVIVFAGLESGSKIARSFTREIVNGETIAETVDFTEGTTITGTVANIGAERERFAILMIGVFDPADINGGSGDFQRSLANQALVGPDGVFQFEAVASGTYTVIVGTDNRNRIAHQVVEVAEAEISVELALP